jgi:hypothetical protein
MESLMDDNNGHSLPPAAEVRKETAGDVENLLMVASEDGDKMTTTESSFLDHDDIGHSLPSAEEIKTTLNSSNRMQDRWKYFGVAMLVLLALIIGISIGASGKKGETTASSATSTGTANLPPPVSSPVLSPVISPVLSPVVAPVTVAAPTLPPGEVRFNSIVDFLSSVSDPILLNELGTVQNKAANWMGSGDTRQYPVPSSFTSISAYGFVQRYVLAVLYLALDGEQWPFQADFLKGVPECEWTETLKTNEGDYDLGVTCDAESEVTTLFFRKYLFERVEFVCGQHSSASLTMLI